MEPNEFLKPETLQTPTIETAPQLPTTPPILLEISKPWYQSKVAIGFAALIIIFLIVMATTAIVSNLVKKPTIIIAPTPTATTTPSPSPMQIPSAIASDSAFIKLDEATSSLSAILRNYAVQDGTLSPPTIEIKLGFPNE